MTDALIDVDHSTLPHSLTVVDLPIPVGALIRVFAAAGPVCWGLQSSGGIVDTTDTGDGSTTTPSPTASNTEEAATSTQPAGVTTTSTGVDPEWTNEHTDGSAPTRPDDSTPPEGRARDS